MVTATMSEIDLLTETRRELAADLADQERALFQLADDAAAWQQQKKAIAEARDQLQQLDARIALQRRRDAEKATAAAAELELRRRAERARLEAELLRAGGQVEQAASVLAGSIEAMLSVAQQLDRVQPVRLHVWERVVARLQTALGVSILPMGPLAHRPLHDERTTDS
jgi:chromosome segregation ATPase